MTNAQEVEFIGAVCRCQHLLTIVAMKTRDAYNPSVDDILTACHELRRNIWDIEEYAMKRSLENERRNNCGSKEA